MGQRNPTASAVLGLVLREPALHEEWRQLLDTEWTESGHEVEVNRTSITAARARTPCVFMGRVPVREVSAHRRRACGREATVGGASAKPPEKPHGVPLRGGKDRLLPADAVNPTTKIDTNLPPSICTLSDRPLTFSASSLCHWPTFPSLCRPHGTDACTPAFGIAQNRTYVYPFVGKAGHTRTAGRDRARLPVGPTPAVLEAPVLSQC